MANPIAQAIATVRQRPALAAAFLGVGAAAIYVSTRGGNEQLEGEAAVAAGQPFASAAAGGGSIQPYALPGGFAPADLATADLANAIREGNAAVINAINAQRAAQAAPSPAPKPVPGWPSGRAPTPPRVPPKGAGPTRPPATPVRVPPQRAPVVQPPQGGKRITYTVRAGDWLSTIASRYGHPGGWQALYQLNRSVVGSNPNLIRPGMRLTVIATRGV